MTLERFNENVAAFEEAIEQIIDKYWELKETGLFTSTDLKLHSLANYLCENYENNNPHLFDDFCEQSYKLMVDEYCNNFVDNLPLAYIGCSSKFYYSELVKYIAYDQAGWELYNFVYKVLEEIGISDQILDLIGCEDCKLDAAQMYYMYGEQLEEYGEIINDAVERITWTDNMIDETIDSMFENAMWIKEYINYFKDNQVSLFNEWYNLYYEVL